MSTMQLMGGSLPIHIVMLVYSVIELDYIEKSIYHERDENTKYKCVHEIGDYNPLHKDIYLMIFSHSLSIAFIIMVLLMELKSYFA